MAAVRFTSTEYFISSNKYSNNLPSSLISNLSHLNIVIKFSVIQTYKIGDNDIVQYS